MDYLHIWLQNHVVNNTSEVSLQVFKAGFDGLFYAFSMPFLIYRFGGQKALHMAEFTLPPSSVEALWYSGDKAQMAGQERASLRQV